MFGLDVYIRKEQPPINKMSNSPTSRSDDQDSYNSLFIVYPHQNPFRSPKHPIFVHFLMTDTWHPQGGFFCPEISRISPGLSSRVAQRQAFYGLWVSHGDLGTLLLPWAFGGEFESLKPGVKLRDVELFQAPGEGLQPLCVTQHTGLVGPREGAGVLGSQLARCSCSPDHGAGQRGSAGKGPYPKGSPKEEGKAPARFPT